MKLSIIGNNVSVALTNTKGEDIYTYRVDNLDVQLDVVRLVESIGDIVQTVNAVMEMERAKRTSPVHNDDDVE